VDRLFAGGVALAFLFVSNLTLAQTRYTIAYASFAPVHSEIFLAEPDGSYANVFHPSASPQWNASFSRDGAWVVNTARGSLVDTEALTRECVSGRLCAFLDTPDPEPLPADSPLYDLANVVLTPHIAGSLGNEIARMGDLAIAEVRRFLAGEPLHHEVRAEDLERIA